MPTVLIYLLYLLSILTLMASCFFGSLGYTGSSLWGKIEARKSQSQRRALKARAWITYVGAWVLAISAAMLDVKMLKPELPLGAILVFATLVIGLMFAIYSWWVNPPDGANRLNRA